jgi:protein-S-isoprenylcysteine O-methyltransferase Ste14
MGPGDLELLGWLQRASVLTSYALIAAELLFLPIPSEVSAAALLSAARASGRSGRSRPGRPLLWIAVLFVEIAASSLALIGCLYPGFRGFLLPLGGGPRPALEAASVVTVLSGTGLSLAAVLQLRRFRSRHGSEGATPAVRAAGAGGGLCTGGLYSLSRNPIQLGVNLTWAGWALSLPSAVMLLVLVLYLVHKHSRILMEEAHLERSFGSPYREYRHAVGRYWPALPARSERRPAPGGSARRRGPRSARPCDERPADSTA